MVKRVMKNFLLHNKPQRSPAELGQWLAWCPYRTKTSNNKAYHTNYSSSNLLGEQRSCPSD